MSTLPGELVDSVIDLTSSSPSMLAACALVCRQWVPRSRYYYFSSIKLVRDRGRDTVKPFLSLVASPLATFISSVRAVQLMHKSSYGAPVLSAGDIIGLLARYGINPTSLYLECQYTQLSIGRTRGEPFPALTYLQLTLYDARMEDGAFEKILNQLQAFPSLKSLALITGPKQPENDLSDTTPRTLPPNVRQLDVTAQPWILGRILLLDPPSNISTLILRRITVGWGEIDKYLSNSRVRATLRSLSLDACDYFNPQVLDFSRLDVLQHLCIVHASSFLTISVLAALTSIRGSSSYRPLDTLEVVYSTLEYRYTVIPEDWCSIDTMLAGPEATVLWPRLRRVTLRVPTSGESPEAVAAFSGLLRQNMPLCHARGILNIILQHTFFQVGLSQDEAHIA